MSKDTAAMLWEMQHSRTGSRMTCILVPDSSRLFDVLVTCRPDHTQNSHVTFPEEVTARTFAASLAEEYASQGWFEVGFA